MKTVLLAGLVGLLTTGCCSIRPESLRSEGIAALSDIHKIEGTYFDDNLALWRMLTDDPARLESQRPGGFRYTKIRVLSDRRIKVSLIADGQSVDHRTASVRYKAGYVQRCRPHFFSIVIFTSCFTYPVGIGLDAAGNLKALSLAPRGFLLLVVIPAVPDTFGPTTTTFLRAAG